MDDRRGTSSAQPYADDIERWLGGDIHDPEGDKIGEVADVYYDEETKQPEWLSVGVGWFGRIRLIPAGRVEKTGRGLRVPYSKDQVKDFAGGGRRDREPGRGAETGLVLWPRLRGSTERSV